jgi:hypothetical protein
MRHFSIAEFGAHKSYVLGQVVAGCWTVSMESPVWVQTSRRLKPTMNRVNFVDDDRLLKTETHNRYRYSFDGVLFPGEEKHSGIHSR